MTFWRSALSFQPPHKFRETNMRGPPLLIFEIAAIAEITERCGAAYL